MALSYNYSTKVVTVDATATLRAIYSDIQENFDDAGQMDDLVPLRADTPTLYTLINGWTFSAGSIAFITSAALQDEAGDNIWTNVQTLGSIATGTTIYIEQPVGTVVWTASTTGHINMLLKVRDAGADIDSKNFTVYARLFQKTYSSFTTTGGAIISNCPLATAADPQLDIADVTVAAYTGLTITWGSVTKDAGDGAGAQPYGIVIDGAGKTLKEIYNWVQRELLQATDIDDGAGTKTGKLTPELVSYTGSMITKLVGGVGVFVEDFAAADANSIKFTDSNGVLRTPTPSVAISVTSTAGAAISGGRVAVIALNAAYNAATYDPTTDIKTDIPGFADGFIIDGTLNASGIASTTMEYTEDIPVVVRTRMAGFQPFEVGTTITSAGLAATAINGVDSVYTA